MTLLKALIVAVTIALACSSVIKHRTKRQSSGTVVWSCDFEGAGWANSSNANGCGQNFAGMTQLTDDNLDFVRTKDPTPSGHTGPLAAISGEYYMYVESSPPAQPGDRVSIQSPELPFGFKTVSFQYYSQGESVANGSIEVFALNANQERLSSAVAVDVSNVANWRSIDDVVLPSGTRYIQFVATLPTTSNYWSADYSFDNIRVSSSDPCISTPCQNGGSCTSVGESYTCNCDTAPGWTGANCHIEDTGGSGADIVFLLDTTGSVGTDGFSAQKELVKSVASRLDIGGKERIAVIRWGQVGEIMFTFNQYTTINTLRSAVDGISYVFDPSMATDISSGLKAAWNLFKDTNSGNRVGSPNALVLITDDVSKLNKGDEYTTATDLKADGVKIMVIAAQTTDERKRLLPPMGAKIASEPFTSNYVGVSSFAEIGANVDFVATALNNMVDNCVDVNCGEGTCVDLINSYRCSCPSNRYGVACELDRNAVSRRTADIVFILDRSGGVTETNFGKMKLMVLRTIQDLNEWFGDDVHFGIVSFGTSASVDSELGSYGAVVSKLYSLQYSGGSSNIQDALSKTRQSVLSQSGDRGGASNFVVLFADGPGNVGANGGDPRADAELLRNTGATLMTVGLGGLVNQDELLQIASYPNSDNFLYRNSFDFDMSVVEFFVNRVIDSNDGCAGNPCQNSGQCIDLSVGYQCNCPSGFGGANCERACNVAYDVVLGIDRSGSLGADFLKELIFIRQVAEIFPSDQSRIGAFSFAGDMRDEFDLSQGTDSSTVRSKIMQTGYTGGSTYLTNAVRRFGQLFTSARGDSSSRANKAILFTDGYAKDDRVNLASVSQQLRSSGVEVFVVGFTNEVKDDELQDIASSADHIIKIDSFDEALFPEKLDSLAGKFCP